jgi:hypothetical protein
MKFGSGQGGIECGYISNGGNMDLKEFIEETVKQIIDGVIGSQKHAKSVGAKVAPFGDARKVSFDVSVTVVDDKESQGKAGLSVWSLGAGISSKNETTNTLAHKIQFDVPIYFPRCDYDQPMQECND